MIKSLPQTVKKSMLYAFLFLFCAAICVWGTSFYLGFPFIDFLKYFLFQIYKNLYDPHHNIIRLPNIAGITFYHYVYFAFLLAFVFLYPVRKVLENKAFKKKQAVSSMLVSLVFTAYIFVTMAQTISFFRFTKKELRIFSWKSTDEKYAKALKHIYLLPKYTKAHLPGLHRAKFISDLDIKKNPEALVHRMLAYFLYPVDIRGIHGDEPFDTVLIFFKKNAVNYIPEGYQLHHTFNDENIIAIRKN